MSAAPAFLLYSMFLHQMDILSMNKCAKSVLEQSKADAHKDRKENVV